MVAIRSNEADRFLAEPPRHIFLYLFFGADAGLVVERRKALLRQVLGDPVDPLQMVSLAGDLVAADPLLLLDEAHAGSLFGGRRAIMISAGPKNFVPALEQLMKTPPLDTLVLIEAGGLKRDSALRKLVEREKAAATIDCAVDGPPQVEELIRSTMAAAKLQIDPDAATLLQHLLGADRLTTRSELAKLVVYCQGRRSVTLSDVEAAVADAAGVESDRLFAAAFLGDLAVADNLARRLLGTSGDSYAVLGPLLRYCMALNRAGLEVDTGSPLDSAAQIMMRSGAFVTKQVLERQLRLWPTARLAELVPTISSAIQRSRREPQIAASAAVRLIWTIARTAAKLA